MSKSINFRPPFQSETATLLVAVRCRPLNAKEKLRFRDILRVVDDKIVVVLDPDIAKEYLDKVQGRSKEKQYAFDLAFDYTNSNEVVYQRTVGTLVPNVVKGFTSTIFAYGATGSGKTHTMVGTQDDPGLMVLSLRDIFNRIQMETEIDFEVTCSYLEVYNEVIYDLLERSSGHLELREDPEQGITIAGLKKIQVNSADRILELLEEGNSRRKTESTDANATSSRSHAVLEIVVKRKEKNNYNAPVLKGKLSLVDLAGSERASETNNAGQKLRDGANINRSLLALANCINALGKQGKKGLSYVPYRNSKLTRLLKDGLSGNSRTAMIATVSSSSDQYQHTTNTLKYADRAKEIKTHIRTNVGTVESHISDYQKMIDGLQIEVQTLRKQLTEKDTQLTARDSKSEDAELAWLDVLSTEISENVDERINLQKALFELEDITLENRNEVEQIEAAIARVEGGEMAPDDDLETLRERHQMALENLRENEDASARYKADISNNEALRKELQKKIDSAIQSDHNTTFLRILSQYRLLGMTNMELQIQMAIRDQIIQDQSDVVNSLWQVLEATGLDHAQIIQVAAENGITIDDNGCPGQVPNIRPGANRFQKDGAGGQNRPKMRLDMLQIIPPEQYRASVLGDNAARDAAAPVAAQSAAAHAEGGYLAAFQNGVNANARGSYAQSHAQSSSAMGFGGGGDHHASPPRSKSPLPSPRPASSPSVTAQPPSVVANGLSTYPGSLGSPPVSPRGNPTGGYKASPFSLVHTRSAGNSPRPSIPSREGLSQRPASSASISSDQSFAFRRGEIAPGERSSGDEETYEAGQEGRSWSPVRITRPTSLRREGWVSEQTSAANRTVSSPSRNDDGNALSSESWASAADDLSDSDAEVRTPVKGLVRANMEEAWGSRAMEGDETAAGSKMVKDNENLRKQITRLGTELASLQKDLHSGRGGVKGSFRRKSSVNYKAGYGSVSDGEDRYGRSNTAASDRRNRNVHVAQEYSTDSEQEEEQSTLTSHRISYSVGHSGSAEPPSYERSRARGLGAVPESSARKSPTGGFVHEKRQSMVGSHASRSTDAGRRRSSKTEGGLPGMSAAAKMRNVKTIPDWR
ncbi:Kinesin-like protein [Klebsormidium nitens]|uniref:Kinesin-like protein KIN-8B n=1 Tax=Klebsormidium nitens TaxID=105231 RepID=A0A1Y1HYT8_KLENI|nr:Kinesin-like protein [Klebsormidium nitens]|eukprot:GAQ83814.1 Kinesin-like protein [Klebsormidium nitens]